MSWRNIAVIKTWISTIGYYFVFNSLVFITLCILIVSVTRHIAWTKRQRQTNASLFDFALTVLNQRWSWIITPTLQWEEGPTSSQGIASRLIESQILTERKKDINWEKKETEADYRSPEDLLGFPKHRSCAEKSAVPKTYQTSSEHYRLKANTLAKPFSPRMPLSASRALCSSYPLFTG